MEIFAKSGRLLHDGRQKKIVLERNGIKILGKNEEINKLDLIREKILLFERQSKKTGGQGTQEEETFANCRSDKVLVN